MLAGELSWAHPIGASEEYMTWKEGEATHQTPWSKLDDLALTLIQKILVPLSSGCSDIKEIQSDPWCK
jgi:serine/threonine-protein kinase Chk1